jgi:phosphoribosylanthranilate isomerase
MNLKLKICGMRDPENIREVIRYVPDYLGFIFYIGSPRYVGDHIEQIRKVPIPADIKKVGVFVNEYCSKILQMREKLHFDMVQLHGNEAYTLCEKLKNEDLVVIKVFSVGEEFDFSQMEPYIDYVDYFLFDTKGQYYGGNSMAFNWSLIDQYPFKVPFFLGGGVGPDNIQEIRSIRNPYIHAVDANSKLELSPALKDISKVEIFRNQFDQINI